MNYLGIIKKVGGFALLAGIVYLAAHTAGWYTKRQSIVELQRQVAAQVDELSGHYYYDFQLQHAGEPDETLLDPDDPDIKRHPLSQFLGPDWLHDIFYVTFAQYDGVPEDGRVTQRTEIGDGDLAEIIQLPGLRWLAVSGTAVSDRGVAALSRLPLERLWLSQTPLTDRGLLSLGQCPSLTHLALEATATSDQGLAAIATLPQLRFLSLGSPYLTADGLQRLGQAQHLSELYLDRLPVDAGVLQALSGLQDMQTLSLRLTPTTDSGLSQLGSLNKLRKVHLDGTSISDEGLRVAGGWKELRELSLTRTAIGNAGLTMLSGCTQLETLRIAQTECTLAGVLELLTVQQARPLSRALQVAFETRRNNEQQLISLDLRDVRVSDSDIGLLAPLRQLQWLKMPNNTLSDTGAQTLVELKLSELSLLEIDGARITKQGLEQLAKIPSLRNLHLGRTAIPAEAIEQLKSHKPSLRVYTEQLAGE